MPFASGDVAQLRSNFFSNKVNLVIDHHSWFSEITLELRLSSTYKGKGNHQMLSTYKFYIISPFLAVLDITILSLKFLIILKKKMTDIISSATKPVKDTVSDKPGEGGGDDNQTNLIDSTQQKVSDTTSQATGTVNSVKENVQEKTGEVTDQVSSTVPGSELVTSKLKELTGSHKLNDNGQVTDKAGNVLATFKEGSGQLKRIAGKKA